MGLAKHFYAYTHSRPDGRIFYVGKGCGRRAWNFTKGRNPKHLAVIRKYGSENIIVTVYPCESEQVAFDLERGLIACHQNLTNMTDGGEGCSGRPISDKTRAAFDVARRVPKTEKARAALAENLKQLWVKNPAMRDNAERLAESRRGVARPKHVVDALVAAHKGKKQSGARLEQTRAAQMVAQEAARQWHASDEGREWHVEHGKKTWDNREWVAVRCVVCGRAFRSPYPSRAKYCQQSCRSATARLKQGKPVGVRPNRRKTSVLSGKRVVGQ